MDSNHVALFEISLKKKWFNTFTIASSVVLGIDVSIVFCNFDIHCILMLKLKEQFPNKYIWNI